MRSFSLFILFANSLFSENTTKIKHLSNSPTVEKDEHMKINEKHQNIISKNPDNLPPGLLDKIDDLLNQSERKFNGCMLVAQNETLIYEKCRGSYGNPTVHNQFLIGSISKQFTSAIILQLVDEGLIDINQPIKKYLPELVDEWAEIVTIKQLLNHTSGVKKLGEPLEFQPGTQFKYSPTLAYYLCSQIAEKVTGSNFELLLNRLFMQANMKNTGIISHSDFYIAKQKHPYLINGFKENGDNTFHEVICLGEEEQKYNNTWIAGGGIISTLEDLLKWNLKLHKGNLIKDHSYKQMITSHAIRNHPRYGTIGYGLGLQLVNENILEISHSGYIDGFTSTLLYYPETEISVIILENISLHASDIKRAFRFHDNLRELIHFETAL